MTPLAGERWIHCYHSLPGACRLESKDGQERAPPRLTDALGEGVVPRHVGDPQVCDIQRVVGLDQVVGFLVVNVPPLPERPAAALRSAARWPTRLPLGDGDRLFSCATPPPCGTTAGR